MNNELVEKNVAYQEQVVQIAKLVFHAFYYDEEEKLNYSPAEDYEKDSVNELLDKAEKIFQFFGSTEEAKKAIRFLHTVNPMKAKEIFDEL
jgi:hypothetical protein